MEQFLTDIIQDMETSEINRGPNVNPLPENKGFAEQNKEKANTRCYGSGTRAAANYIKEYIRGELYAFAYYKHLAIMAKNKADRKLFREFSQEERIHARKLSTAYFIASGYSYFPKEIPALKIPPYKMALRERFLEENSAHAKYEDLARKTDDECLAPLLKSLAQDELRHADAVLKVIEEME